MALVHASYFTDPCCPWSWAIEPALRRLEVEFGDQVRFTYVMAGLHRELQDGREPAGEWLDASASSQMPVDVRLWL
ncbi:MAG TPA: DsbA family protein, partial [Solirubrobacteraceae bacterium]|nr:DsbA family protein [Solirubrobacteraceae bacterium]